MPANVQRKKLECGHTVYIARSDTKYCSEICRERLRIENAKFEISKIPQSGVVGVTYNRVYKRWEVRVKVNSQERMKYVGAFATLKEAVQLGLVSIGIIIISRFLVNVSIVMLLRRHVPISH